MQYKPLTITDYEKSRDLKYNGPGTFAKWICDNQERYTAETLEETIVFCMQFTGWPLRDNCIADIKGILNTRLIALWKE